MLVSVLVIVLGLALGAGVGLWRGRVARSQQASSALPAGRAESERLRADADLERQSLLRDAEIAAREDAVARRAAADPELRQRAAALLQHETALAGREATLEELAKAIAQAREKLKERSEPVKAREAETRAAKDEVQRLAGEVRRALERAAGESGAVVQQGLVDAELEEVRGAAAQLVRAASDAAADPEHIRRAKRIMGISVGRFSGHYLTERHLSHVSLVDAKTLRTTTVAEPDLEAIAAVAGVRLLPTETGDAVRLEGLDGVGREVARRCLAKLLRRPTMGTEAVTRMAKEIVADLDREIMDLGKRAFTTLEIERAHPEIVKLVGRLNWRTSYTQNQWKHAVEAAFLCGMMADELGLDRKIARRAALMHDIGKALTHEMDGSHAVIGADYARRLGERELVANAIGAHHTDEPFSSPYAYLVAAADAMSGARPGARRQTEDNHVAKLAELERLSRNFRGVAEAFAVQGGREVRVYVEEDRVDDLGAVKLSSQIAEVISREMTFPGQIKVTVIREFRAVDTAS